MIVILPDGSALVLRRCPDCGLNFSKVAPSRAVYCAECSPRRKQEQDAARRRRLFG